MTKDKLELLEKEFIGIGEMKGFTFRQISMSEAAYLYILDENDTRPSYEVIMRKSSPKCLDFENRIYSVDLRKEYYPKSGSFGILGWAYTSMEMAKDKFNDCVVLLASDNGKVNIVAGATKKAVKKGIHIGKVIGEVAKITGGGGGGRPDMAQAGGKEASKIDEALAVGRKLIIEKLS